MFRTICQEGFSVVVSKTTSVVDLLLGKTESELVQEGLTPEQREQLEKDKITFSHENKNIDSGRKKLWLESINLFKLSPIIGISNGNIVLYSAEYSNGALEYSYHKSDLHKRLSYNSCFNWCNRFCSFRNFRFSICKTLRTAPVFAEKNIS